MKKNYDYGKAEEWARRGYSGADRYVRYDGGAAHDAVTDKSEAGRSPVLQIAGGFLVAAIVAGATFGGFKYMEYAGGRTQPGDTPEPVYTDSGYEDSVYEAPDSADESDEITKVGYEDSPDGFLYVTSGRTRVFCKQYDTAKLTMTENGTVLTAVSADKTAPYEFDYQGPLLLHDNVEDREMTLVSFSAVKVRESRVTEEKEIEGFYPAFLDSAPEGRYLVTFDVTWDGFPLKETGDECLIYSYRFIVNRKATEDSFTTDYDYGEILSGEFAVDADEYVGGPRGFRTVFAKYERTYENGQLTDERELEGEKNIVEFGQTLAFCNTADVQWTVLSVTVDGVKYGGAEEAAAAILEKNDPRNGDQVFHVTLEASWDPEAVRKGSLDGCEGRVTAYYYELTLVHKPKNLEYGEAKLLVSVTGTQVTPDVSERYVINEDGEKVYIEKNDRDVPHVNCALKPVSFYPSVSLYYDEQAVEFIKATCQVDKGNHISFSPDELVSSVFSDHLRRSLYEGTEHVSFHFRLKNGSEEYIVYKMTLSLTDSAEDEDTENAPDKDGAAYEWLSSVMRPGMTVNDLLRDFGDVAGKASVKQHIAAASYDQISPAGPGTYFRISEEGYDLAYLESDSEPHALTSVRLIMRRECTGLELPYGITADMTSGQVLQTVGYTEEEIRGLYGTLSRDGMKITYNNGYLTVTYSYANGAFAASFGLEYSSEGLAEAYVEMEYTGG